jgi:hypothetical protein
MPWLLLEGKEGSFATVDTEGSPHDRDEGPTNRGASGSRPAGHSDRIFLLGRLQEGDGRQDGADFLYFLFMEPMLPGAIDVYLARAVIVKGTLRWDVLH